MIEEDGIGWSMSHALWCVTHAQLLDAFSSRSGKIAAELSRLAYNVQSYCNRSWETDNEEKKASKRIPLLSMFAINQRMKWADFLNKGANPASVCVAWLQYLHRMETTREPDNPWSLGEPLFRSLLACRAKDAASSAARYDGQQIYTDLVNSTWSDFDIQYLCSPDVRFKASSKEWLYLESVLIRRRLQFLLAVGIHTAGPGYQNLPQYVIYKHGDIYIRMVHEIVVACKSSMAASANAASADFLNESVLCIVFLFSKRGLEASPRTGRIEQDFLKQWYRASSSQYPQTAELVRVLLDDSQLFSS